MTTQYTSILKLALPVQGELSGTWGNVVNDNITSMIEEAIAGRAVINSWTANAHTLTSADGLTSESRAAMLEFTDSGVALTGNAEVICPTASKIYIAKNAVGNSYTVTLKTSAGTGIAIPDGTTMLLFCDGTNVVEAVTNINSLSVGGYTVTLAGAVTTAAAFSTVGANALTLTTTGVTDVTLPTTGTLATLDGTETLTNKTITSPDMDGGSVDNATIGAATPSTGVFTNLTANTDLTINASTTVNGIIDDDSMGTASNTTLATSESVKAYVDSQVGANNELSEVLANGNTTGGTNIVVTAGDSITTDSILETTAAAGVDIDGVLLKDTSVGTDDASGTDIAGTNVTVKGGAGTGAGAGGSLVFQTAPAGLTGSTPNTQVTAMSIDSTGAVDMNVSLNVDGAATIDSLTITTGSTVTTILDEDNLGSDSDTALATQQSIKAYVDAQVTAQDLDFQADTGGTLSIDLDSEIQVFAGGTGIDTSGALNTVTIAIDSTVATLTDAQTLTNKTIDASLNTLSNIANASLTNSTVSYGGIQLSLGGVDATPAFNLVDATGYLGDSALVTTGALNSGSITSGFGSIDVGSSAITGGLVTAASLSVTGDLTVDTSTLKVDSANNRVGILNTAPDVSFDAGSATDAMHVPVGTTAQRPGTPAAGYFRYNADLEQFEGYTDAWGAIGGGGTNTFTFDSFTGDNATVDFVLSQATNLEGNLIVFIDGVFQTQDAYTISTVAGVTTLTFSAAPATGRYIAVYTVAAGVSGNNMNLDSFSGDGATTDFTLSINAINENNTQIFIDGVYQQKDGYTVTNTTLSFSAAPPLNSTIEVMTFTQTEVNVPVDNSIEPIHIKAGDFYFDTDTLYIDSVNNRVGVGTASPSGLLTSYKSLNGDPVLGHFYNDNAGTATEATVYVTNSSTASDGLFLQSQGTAFTTTSGFVQDGVTIGSGTGASGGLSIMTRANADMRFYTNGHTNERMRIDASGVLFVNKTASDIANVGHELHPAGFAFHTRDNAEVLYLNRKTSDGAIQNFYKDGAQVGSIGVEAGDNFYIADSAGNSGLNFKGFVNPVGSNGETRDAAIDLGNSTGRFKDLYLSGNVKVDAGQGILFGGAAGASGMTSQVLDDYEEGSFTATLRGATEPGTLVTTTATYTKIGNRVFIIISFENINTTGYSGVATIDGLPFPCSQTRAVFYLAAYNSLTWTDTPLATVSSGGSTLGLQDQVSGSVWQNVNHNAGSLGYIWVTGHYIAT